jgi:5'-3' exonuclease
MTKAVLLDTSSFIHRAYHASKERPTFTKDGTPNFAVNLFRTMLEPLAA